ncbi:phage scaffolding protein [Streptomyces sp. NPDC049590]|uniref:phage scaffolding protein n=1 Tax=Streptomyces sp. NPDC049590 TaxID=3154834 RepID=UPI00344A4258
MEDTQERPNDIEAMQAALHKANAEAQKHREQRNTYRDLAARLAAQNTLAEAGLTNSKAAKLIDYSKVSVTETGELEGLTEQLDAFKEDFPELFGGTKRISGGGDAANKTPITPKPKTSAERLVAQLHGN